MNLKLIQEPFGRIVTPKNSNIYSSVSLSQIFDAVYIPSRGRRIPLEETTNALLPYCKEYVFLFTDSIPDWFEKTDKISSLCGNTIIRAIRVAESEHSNSYTSKAENQNISVQWRMDFDIPLKRSYALYDARRRGYRYIGMIDDDILMEAEQIQNAVYALENGNCVVGFHVDWYPDKCTLDHIRRELTGKQENVAMTGSGLFLDVDEIQGDFPLVYNEDLFFFLQQLDFNRVVSGGIIHQKQYESWKNGDRVMHEQFGELVYIAILKRLTEGQYLGKVTRGTHIKANGETIKTELGHINWNAELANAKKRVEDIIALDDEGSYTCILERALVAIENIKTENIKNFVDEIPFPTFIKSIV